jgi:multiple sugar transport system permease protein
MTRGVAGDPAEAASRGRAAARPSARARRGPLASESRWAWLFLAPTIVGLAVLSAGPILAAFAISLTRWDLLTAPDFVGLGNYQQLLGTERFLAALRNTTFYTVVSVPLGMVLALDLATALNQAIRGISWIRTAYFLLLGSVGLPAQRWVSDPTWAMPSIIAMSIWQGLPVNVIIFLAGLQGIPSEYYDAASVDGANRRARFRHVTLPLLTPSIFFTGILALISAFQVFDQIYVMSNPGKPTGSTITVVYFIYENGFRNFKMGLASAASWILFLIVAVLTILYFRSQRRWVHYQ